ncbi:cupin domain-containing protein [Geoalkalibacter halelectricus]|uniref:Cupin domain-containing protein n=1 Tax=Geoalkalibacter halelectricus TaxID=2847045 RepID=A0ABY5ZUJ4_9BACT|nr:cupin domain-containing protein [Geoalkalibacter halelectricus]MDO3376729.1 cupin domain-containing protein [Geoalkalibacter halelectricus]UWZ81319.1 cupin domain-containing protein [Geoalkalibacter halelectricus]
MTSDNHSVKLEGGVPTHLAELVDYQDGAVVSRTLLQDETGTLTVFSFDEGQALSEHTVPYHAFVQVLDGEAEITVGQNPSTVKAGQIILMPGHVSHRVRAVKKFKMLLTLFKAAQASAK